MVMISFTCGKWISILYDHSYPSCFTWILIIYGNLSMMIYTYITRLK